VKEDKMGWRDEKCIKIFIEKPEGRRQLGDPSVEGRLILK
jgi:hypothetical protein